MIPYFRGTSGIALFYDITKERTFSNIPKWLYTISEYASYDVQIALVGNRVHLETERQVSEERGRKLASNYDILFFESSSYTNVNVAEVFEALTTKILEYRSMMPPMEPVKGDTTKKTISDDIIRLDHNKGKRSAANVRINNGCCC